MSTSSDVYSEEPYALIGHVRFCEGEVRAQNGAHPLYSTRIAAQTAVNRVPAEWRGHAVAQCKG